MCSPDHQYQHHLGNCYKYKFSGPILIRTLEVGPSKLFNKSLQWCLCMIKFENHRLMPCNTIYIKLLLILTAAESTWDFLSVFLKKVFLIIFEHILLICGSLTCHHRIIWSRIRKQRDWEWKSRSSTYYISLASYITFMNFGFIFCKIENKNDESMYKKHFSSKPEM